jgi:hypothetical protein
MTELRLPPDIHPSDTLLILRIPPPENTILKLLEHFKRYGRIQSIHSDGYHTALITFSTQQAAEIAFKSPEAYAGNRLVQYRFPKDPEKVESKLSSIVVWPKVNRILAEVASEIAAAHEETAKLQDEIKQTHAQQAPSADQISLQAVLEEFKASRIELIQTAEKLMKQQGQVGEEQWAEIEQKLDVLAAHLIEVEDSIAQIEEQLCS